MKPSWTMRQLLAILRGIALMVALLCGLILFQLVPSLLRGGLAGVRDHITRVAVAGVPPGQWDIAITRMYLALGVIFAIAIVFYLAQHYLGRKLQRGTPSRARCDSISQVEPFSKLIRAREQSSLRQKSPYRS